MPRRGEVKSLPVIIEALESIGPMSLDELVRHTGYSLATVGPAIAKLRAERRAYINRWYRPTAGGRKPTRVFALGSLPDCKYRNQTLSETSRKHRERHAARLALRSAPGLGVFGFMAHQLAGRAA